MKPDPTCLCTWVLLGSAGLANLACTQDHVALRSAQRSATASPEAGSKGEPVTPASSQDASTAELDASTADADASTPLVEPRLSGFVLGIKHDSWSGRDGQLLLNDLDAIAAAGFNTLRPSLDANAQEFLDKAQSLNIDIIAQFDWAEVDTTAAALRDFPAMLGWSLDEGFNWGESGGCNNPGFTPPELRQRHERIQSVTGGKLTYASGVGSAAAGTPEWIEPCKLGPYTGSADIIGVQSYYIDNGIADADVLELNAQVFKQAWLELGAASQPYVANVQAFAWNDVAPNPSEFRNMLYAGLLYGAHGFILEGYFNFRGWLLPRDSPELWQEVQRVVKEVQQLVVALEQPPRVINTAQQLHAAVAIEDSVLIVMSTERSATIAADFALPEDWLSELGTNLTLEPMFPERPGNLRLNDGKVVGSVVPESVHVYRVVGP